jgi:hypothetical protein
MKHRDLLNKPITNYQQMKIIFDQAIVQNIKGLFSPRNLMVAINHLADNKADGTPMLT